MLFTTGESYLRYVQMEPADNLVGEGKIKSFPHYVFERYRRSTPEEEEGDYVNGVILKYQVLC